MSLPHTLILHGLGGSGPEHWQNWLAGELAHHGGSVDLPRFSSPDEPELSTWLEELRAHLAAMPAGGSASVAGSGPVAGSGSGSGSVERVVVAHSLAVLLWLHHAAGEFDPGLRVDRVLLVAPPAPDFAGEPLISGFLHPVLDPTVVRRAAVSTRLVVGEGDAYCTVAQAKEMAEALRVEVDVIVGGGHLNVDAGYGEWGAVLKWVRSGRVPVTPR